MTTTFYPDISGFQRGISLAGADAVCIKATEGTYYANGDYARAKSNAQTHNAYPFAYHFLVTKGFNGSGGPVEQARWCFQHVGKTPVMLDVELEGSSSPGVSAAAAFVDEFRKLGGVIHLVYLPHWYWRDHLGSPDLGPLKRRGMCLVSSEYTGYTDGGPGWTGYGGMTPEVWQFTSSRLFNGMRVDFNAFKGTVTDLKSVAQTGHRPSKYALNPVKGLTVTERYTQADVHWSAATNAHKGYRVIVRKGWAGKTVQKFEQANTAVTLHNLDEGTRYAVSVLALPASPLALVKGRAKVTFTTKDAHNGPKV
jgi:hypothetical protein